MKPTIPVPTDLATIAAAQGGVFTRPQVLASGGCQSLLTRLLRDGSWLRLAQGVYTASEPSFLSLCWAGILLADGPATIGGIAAAHLRGLCSEPERLTIWGDRSRTQGPWEFRRGHRAGWGLPSRVGPEDAVLEACAESPLRRVPDLLHAAILTRTSSPQRLREHAVELRNLRHRSLILKLLPNLEGGIESTLESHFLHQVQRPHLLPEGIRQVSVSEGTRSDVVLPEYKLIIELDGRRGHEGPGKWRDARRDNRHLLAGFATLRFGWHDVVLEPCVVAGVVAEALLQRGWSGLRGKGEIRRCGRRCTVARASAKGLHPSRTG